MAYIGNNSTVSNIQKIDSLAFNSSSTTFDIRVGGVLVVVGSSTSTIISVGGVIQEPSVDYTVNGSSIIFAVAPATGLSFFGIILGSSVNIGVPADNSITNTKIAETISILKGGTGATTADAALTNLGGGAAGKAVFASATQANARTQLGLGTAAVLDVSAVNVPIGASLEWNGSSDPTNFMIEDGRAISRTTYSVLYGILGTTFGVGDGSTTFNIPNSINRVSVGAGGLYSIGGTGGSKDAIVPAHTHSINDPGHTHFSGNYTHTNQYTGNGGGSSLNGSAIYTGSSATGITVNSTGSSATDANMMPYIAKRKIIRVL